MADSSSPRALDIGNFASRRMRLDGCEPLEAMDRIASVVVRGDVDAKLPVVNWRAQGEFRARPGQALADPWLFLEAESNLNLVCQRCLSPVSIPVQLRRAYRFLPTQAQANAEDLDADEDVLAMDAPLDLLNLIEDELLLAMPMVPMHADCGDDWMANENAGPSLGEASRPFDVLLALKRP